MTHVHCTPSAGRNKPKVPFVPFAAIPHDLVSDSRLNPADIRLVAVILRFARSKPWAWPSNGRLAAELGCSVRTVQNGLRRLKACGWVRTVPAANPTGRRIILAWRDDAHCTPRAQPVAPRGCEQLHPKEIVIVEGDAWKEFTLPQERERRPEPDPPALAAELPRLPALALPPPSPVPLPAPAAELPARVALTVEQGARLRELPAATRDCVLTWLATGDRVLLDEANRVLAPPPEAKPAPASLPELLARIQDDPRHPAMAAELLAQDFNDRKSWRAFHKVCEQAWRGELASEALLQAWREASGGKARNPGAVFHHVLRRERS
jgi:helix-turn-helix protein